MSKRIIGFIILVVFAFLRPLTLTMVDVSIFTFSAFEIFGVAISYMMLIPILMNLRNFRLDRTTLLSILFCFYCIESILLGSDFTIVARVTLPFIVFFATRILITEPKQIHTILVALIIGYLMPIVTSTYMIIVGRGIEIVDYWTKITYFQGLYGGSHGLGYAMLFFSFIYCLQKQTCQLNGRLAKSGLLVIQLLAIFCLFKSYTRTAMVGFIIFWVIYLWGFNKKRFILAIIASVLLAIVASQQVKIIFLKTRTDQFNLNDATSGRLTIWHHNIQLFLDSSIPQQILGRGLGNQSRKIIGDKSQVWSPHNNYLNLLMSLGVVGLLMYLTILASLFWDLFTCGLERKLRYFYLGLIVSVAIMNFFSNAVIFRVELSQYFWLFMGFFYFTKEKAEADRHSNTELSRIRSYGSHS